MFVIDNAYFMRKEGWDEKGFKWAAAFWQIIICADFDIADHRAVYRIRECFWERQSGKVRVFSQLSLHTALRAIYIRFSGFYSSKPGAGLCCRHSDRTREKDKGYAALTGLVSFVIFINAMHQVMQLSNRLVPADQMQASGQALVLNVQVLEMGVFSGILLGALVSVLHNQYCDKQFKGVMQIYSGHRFVAILAIPSAMILGALASEFWPFAQNGITWLANSIKDLGVFGFLVYGFLERILIPTGLHHLIYTPFLYTELGGTAHIGGDMIYGARNIYFAEMADKSVKVLSGTVNWDARGLSKMFGLMGAALALYATASKKKKKQAKAILLLTAVTSFLLGVTEPLEFSFLFVAPILFVVHAVLA